MVGASALQLVDLGFISQVESYQKTLKNGIHSFPAWRSAHRGGVENKPAILLVVSLSKAFNWMPPSRCGRQVASPAVYPSWWPSLTKDMQTEHELIPINKKKVEIMNKTPADSCTINICAAHIFLQKQIEDQRAIHRIKLSSKGFVFLGHLLVSCHDPKF